MIKKLKRIWKRLSMPDPVEVEVKDYEIDLEKISDPYEAGRIMGANNLKFRLYASQDNDDQRHVTLIGKYGFRHQPVAQHSYKTYEPEHITYDRAVDWYREWVQRHEALTELADERIASKMTKLREDLRSTPL